MPIFQTENNKIKQLKTSNFKNEKELQTLVENNLEEIFGVKFIASELSTGEKHGGRIDTLGLDENNSPVIIEYKWGEKDNVINQGLFYLDWLVDHKGDFQILTEKKLKKIKIDWSQPRLILIASAFNKYDKYAINRMSENIELWTYTLYENDIFEVNIEGISQASDKKGRRITKIEYAKYDLNYHRNKTPKDLQKKFNEIREKILEWSNVQEKPEQKSGVTYKTTRSFVRFEFGKNHINALIRNSRYGHIIDPKGAVKDITTFEWGYKGLIKITKETDTNYLLDLIRQSYEETL